MSWSSLAIQAGIPTISLKAPSIFRASQDAPETDNTFYCSSRSKPLSRSIYRTKGTSLMLVPTSSFSNSMIASFASRSMRSLSWAVHDDIARSATELHPATCTVFIQSPLHTPAATSK